MGACLGSQSTSQGVEHSAESTQALLERGLKDVKTDLINQYKNPTMVAEIIKMLFTFVQSTLTTGHPQKVKEFIGVAFMGLHMMDGYVADGVRFPLKIGSALHNLTEPEHLSCRDLEDNFLSCAHIFEQVQEKCKKTRGAQLDWRDATEELEARAAIGEEDDGGTSAREVASGPSYKELQKIMLNVLEPLCDMVDGLLNPHVEGRFLGFTKKKPDYLEKLKNKLGIVTTIVKVFEPSSEGDSGIQLLAVMGPESYGKSTLINHILNKGQNKDVMPATPGMGTQVVCKIAAGPLETLQRASDEFPQTGDVKRMVETMNAEMRKKRMVKTQRNMALGIREMEMLRATVRFDPPYAVEFLDVPGTKEETLFHTRVALGLATTLVLVSGRVDDLRSQLESGDLSMLKDAVKGLNHPIPIQCLASFHIKESEFNSSKHLIKQALQENFPTCKNQIQEPLFMNFFEARDDSHRQAMVERFYAAMAAAERQVVDPFDRFLSLRNDVEEFTATLHKYFHEEMGDFLASKISGPEGCVYQVKEKIKEHLKSIKSQASDLEKVFSPDKIKDRLGSVQVGRLGTFQHHAAGTSQEEVKNVALYVQSLLNQCRLRHMEWLKDSSQEFHNKSFGKAFSPLKDMAPNSPEKSFSIRLCQTFKFCSQHPGARGRDSKSWWTQEYTSHIAPYLDGMALGCLFTGFHLVSTDTRNKVDLLSLIMTEETRDIEIWNNNDNGLKEQMIKDLDGVNYSEWVTSVRKKMPNRDAAFEELFKTIEDSCRKFAGIARSTGFLHRAQNNLAMEALVEMAFVLVERMFVEITDETEGEFTYTKFAEHLRKGTSNAELRKAKPIIEGEDRELACSACCEALRVMQQNPSVSATWTAKFRSRALEQDIAKIQTLREMLTPKFAAGHDRAMLLIPQDSRKVVSQRSVVQGQAYPIASACLAVLDHKIKLRADQKPSKEFAPYALREIQQAGARVAVFMRRGDTASYDPLHEETMLLEKLQGEPNLVTLFVLWNPSQPGTEWNTPDFTQKWKSSHSSESSLDVRLIPMSASFDCQRFVDGEVADAITAAAAKAQLSLGRVREKEKAMLLSFASEVERYEKDFASAQTTDPNKFHSKMGDEHRQELNRKMRELRDTEEDFDIPPWEFNQENFKIKTLDQVKVASEDTAAAGDGSSSRTTGGGDAAPGPTERKEGTTFNELQCRSFNFQLLLGQCVQKCSRLAELVFEKVVTQILNEVGDKEFFMTGSQIAKELDIFCNLYKDNQNFKAEIKRLGLLKSMITKESFQHMYVGCVSHMLMPALYATILPLLFKGTGGKEEPTDAVYKEHIAFAKTMLRKGSARSRQMRRATA